MQKSLADANINIEFTNVLGADLDEKRNLVLNSGEYPDIYYFFELHNFLLTSVLLSQRVALPCGSI